MIIVNPTAKLGEDIACEYLHKKGYKIIERNFRKSYGELDIVALISNTLVLVEVKTRKTSEYGSPFESITPRKLRSLVKTAEFYKLINPKLPERMRIDAIAVKLFNDDSVEDIEHAENITGF